MRFRVRKSAHVLERIGLAMAGAACGLFVAAHVGSSIDMLTSQGFIVVMMIAGAIGFYLGIDTPPLPFHEANAESDDSDGKIDTAEFLSAVRHVSRHVDGIRISQRDCVSGSASHLLDNHDHAGMGRWRGDANHRRSNCAHAPIAEVQRTSRPFVLAPKAAPQPCDPTNGPSKAQSWTIAKITCA